MDTLKGFKRTDYCGDLRLSDAGRTVSVCGWVQRQRDLGGLIFVDLRDRTGLVQLSFGDDTAKDIFEKAASQMFSTPCARYFFVFLSIAGISGLRWAVRTVVST